MPKGARFYSYIPESQSLHPFASTSATLQIRQLRSDLNMEPDPASCHCEAHAIRSFQTLINRRLFVSKKKREACMQLA